MEEKKLTNEEIVKALECCVKGETCTTCPYFIKGIDCVYHLKAEGDVLDLIRRLQEQNESLKPDHYRASWKAKFFETKQENEKLKTELRKECEEHEEFTKKAKAEIERLTEEKEDYYFQWKNAQTYNENHEEIWAKNERQTAKEKAELQKQVDELTKENERLSDLEFTQEHCDLYKENEYLKSCLVLAKQQAVKDTAKEIFSFIVNQYDGEYFLHNVETFIADKYGVEVE